MVNYEFDRLITRTIAKLLVFGIVILLLVVVAAMDDRISSVYSMLIYILLSISSIFSLYLILKKDLIKYYKYSSQEIETGRIYKDAITSNTNAIISINEELRAVYFNDAAKKMFFLTFAKFNNLPVTELVHKEDKDKFIEQIKASAGTRDIYKINCGHLNTTDEDFYAYFTIKKYLYQGQNTYLLIATDCSEIYRQIATTSKKINLLEKIIETAPLAISVFDTSGKCIISNINTYETTVSYSNGDTITKDITPMSDFYSLVRKTRGENILTKGFETASTGSVFSKNALFVQDKKDRWLNLTFTPVSMPDKNYVAYSYSDITYTIERYNEVSLYSRAYFEIFDNSEFSMIMLNSEGRIIEVNRRFSEWIKKNNINININSNNLSNYSISIEELIGNLNIVLVVINPTVPTQKVSFSGENIDEGIREFLRKIENAEVFDSEFQFIAEKTQNEYSSENHVSEKTYTIYNKNFPVSNANGNFKFSLLEFTDKTELNEIIKRYNSARIYLDAIANNFTMGIVFIINQNEEIVFIGGEEAVKKELLISGLYTRLFFKISQIPDIKKLSSLIQNTLNGEIHKQEYEIFGVRYLLNLVPIRDSHGRIRFCMGIGFNVNERYEHELQLAEQKKFYETIFENVLTPVAVINLDKKVTNANKAYLEMFGVKSITELVGYASMDKSVYSVYPDDIIKAQRILDEADKVFSGEVVNLEVEFPAGSTPTIHTKKIFNIRITPIFDNSKEVSHCVLLLQDVTELRSLIEELEETQNQLKIEKEFRDKIFDKIANPVSVFNTNKEIVYANKKFLEFFNYSSFDEIASNTRDLESINPIQYENFPEAREQFLKVITGEAETAQVEIVIRKNDSKFLNRKIDNDIISQVIITSIRDSSNKLTHVIYMLQDITELKTNVVRLEEAQRQLKSEKLLRGKIFDEALLPLATINITTNRFVEVNRAFIDLFSIPDVSLLKEVDLTKPTIYKKNPELFSYFLQVVQGKNINVKITVPKGENPLLRSVLSKDTTVIIKASPVFDTNGKATHSIVAIQDITELQKVVEEIKESRKINDIVVSNFHEGVLLLVDKNLVYKLVAGHAEAARIDKNKLIGASMLEHPNLIGQSFLGFVEHTFSEAEFYCFDLYDATNGTYYDVSLQPIVDELVNEVEYVLIVMINITDRKQFEQSILDFNKKLDAEVDERTKQLQEASIALENRLAELNSTQAKLLFIQKELAVSLRKEQELNKMKSRFISLISHEYRTPLTIIRTYTYLLEHFFDKQDKEKFTNSTSKISIAIDTMTQLLNNVLFLDEEDMKLELAEVDFVEVVLETIQATKISHKSNNRINFTRDVGSLNIISDKHLLRQIVDNLLSNAIKYSPENSIVNINLLELENEVKLEVRDFGVGVHDDVIDNIYDSFVRSAEVTNISGAGLGLYIAKRCVDYLHGKIIFDTERDVGTTFTVVLPKHLENSINNN